MDTPSTQTTINKTQLPPWVDAAAQQNLAMANKIAAKPYQAYNGQLTAGMTATGQNALNSANANNGYWTGDFNNAANTAGDVTGYQAKNFLSGNLQSYMNPYIQNVEDRALANMDTSFRQNLNTIGDGAISKGAFGGSRQGIAEGVAASENARQMGDLSAELRAQGFDTASGLMMQDYDRDLQAAQTRLGAAQAQSDIATAGNTAANQNATLLATLGEQERLLNQQKLQEQYAKWQEKQNYDVNNLNLRLAAVGATPYGGTQTQTTTGGGGNNAGMQIFGSVLSMLPFLAGLSDREDKTDIEKLGKDPKTGLDMYAYRYKGDPKSYPKVVGPMAQDIEKKDPKAVRKIGGHRVINLGFGG